MAQVLKPHPQGVDGYFENVGGYLLDAAAAHQRLRASCGMIAGYGQPLPLQNPALILINRLKVQGFIVSEHMDSDAGAAGAGLLVAQGSCARANDRPGHRKRARGLLGLLKGRNWQATAKPI